MSSKFQLKKCVSTKKLSLCNIFKNVTNPKSHEEMSGTSSQDSIVDQRFRNGVDSENALELFYQDDEQPLKNEKNTITTQDQVSGTLFHVNKQTLEEKKHSKNEIASTFKKDCRMWLWKNSAVVKKSRSVAENENKT